jgi:glucoamylase
MNDVTAMHDQGEAPGAPGLPPRWSNSAKEAVGCALGPSRLWFTMGQGIVNEVYYPRIDIPQIRDLGFIVADGKGFWIEVKSLARHEMELASPGVPAVTVRHRHARFILTLRVAPDLQGDALLVEVVLDGEPGLRPYVLLAPHLGGTGDDNDAWTGRHRGRQVLWAERGPFGLALAAADSQQQDAFGQVSAGCVGISDGWQDFARNRSMQWSYSHAGPGNVALLGQLPRYSVLALGLGSSKESAATLAVSALARPFEDPWRRQIAAWNAWHQTCRGPELVDGFPQELCDQLLTSAMVLHVHGDQTYPGAMVASLSIPWGDARDERGGYHLVWPRDLVECAGALLALGAEGKAQETLRYLIATQHEDGHWYQNQWLGGKSYWQGIQLDEAAFPVLLAAALAERDALNAINVQDMVRRALTFIAHRGPASDQDRWEENAGVNTFTLAVCIAALVTGAQFLPPLERDTALAIADYWNSRIESWTAVRGTTLAQRCGVTAYYVRVAPPRYITDEEAISGAMPVKNRLQDPGLRFEEQVGTEFLQLVRFGLRQPDDPLIRDSIKVVDALLRVTTPSGPAWRRYNGDGYGEHEDGSPFDGTGIGRAWPLLCGERGHYEIMAGNSPAPYLQAMASMAGPGGMIPEQVWDRDPVPQRNLYPGRPSGSAMPLAWAHAEFVKLAYSWALKRPFDRPAAVWARYQGRRATCPVSIWSPGAVPNKLRAGQMLRMYLPEPGRVQWHAINRRTTGEVATDPAGLGLHRAEIDTRRLDAGERLHLRVSNGASARPPAITELVITEPSPS